MLPISVQSHVGPLGFVSAHRHTNGVDLTELLLLPERNVLHPPSRVFSLSNTLCELAPRFARGKSPRRDGNILETWSVGPTRAKCSRHRQQTQETTSILKGPTTPLSKTHVFVFAKLKGRYSCCYCDYYYCGSSQVDTQPEAMEPPRRRQNATPDTPRQQVLPDQYGFREYLPNVRVRQRGEQKHGQTRWGCSMVWRELVTGCFGKTYCLVVALEKAEQCAIKRPSG